MLVYLAIFSIPILVLAVMFTIMYKEENEQKKNLNFVLTNPKSIKSIEKQPHYLEGKHWNTFYVHTIDNRRLEVGDSDHNPDLEAQLDYALMHVSLQSAK